MRYSSKQAISEMTSKITGVASPSHGIECDMGSEGVSASVKLSNKDPALPLVRNFELHISLAEPDKYMY